MFKIKTRKCFKSALPLLQRTNSAENDWSSNQTIHLLHFHGRRVHIICRCIPCQAMNCTWSDNRNFPKTRKKQIRSRVFSTFPQLVNISDLMDVTRQEARDVHVYSSCCRYRRVSVRSPHILIPVRTYIYVHESQRFWDFVRKYTYESRKGLINSEKGNYNNTNLDRHRLT